MRMRMRMRMRVRMCIHVHTCAYMCIHVHTCAYMCIHVHSVRTHTRLMVWMLLFNGVDVVVGDVCGFGGEGSGVKFFFVCSISS